MAESRLKSVTCALPNCDHEPKRPGACNEHIWRRGTNSGPCEDWHICDQPSGHEGNHFCRACGRMWEATP